ncbi:Uncharacterized protein PECH_001036 [Penicillium ucsense]|uniref:Uncharacterized protein n=1 Tax=Penicillium ucsense TaxID=2839758 RepID=A0A8J8WMC0_9EURO|nr:Uncharacterized protein PECM_002405 [Penicillium ucsense]KAF7738276.1 Uncharacterized protein PECH_001036 [Penicillium ucsense]
MEVLDDITKLKGESNFGIWQKDLECYVQYQDPDLWLVMTGAILPPMSDYLKVPSEQEVRFNISAEEGTNLDEITSAQVSAWLRTNNIEKNKEFADWSKLNAGCFLFLLASLEDSIKIFIEEFDVASSAYDYICATWGQKNPQLFQQKYNKWVSCHYRQGGNAAGFVRKRKRLLHEAQRLNPNIIHASWQQAQFVYTISMHPGTESLVTRLQPNLNDAHILEDMIAEFQSFEYSRHYYSAMATSAKKNSNSLTAGPTSKHSKSRGKKNDSKGKHSKKSHIKNPKGVPGSPYSYFRR